MTQVNQPEPGKLFFYALNESVLEVRWHEPAGRVAEIPEALVQDIWRLQQVNLESALSTQGLPVQVLAPGILNTDSGPDFFDARISVGGVMLEGHVEIHVRSGIWYEHKHHEDAAYDDVILHVSLESDLWTGRLRTRTGRVLPEIILGPLLRLPLRSLLYAFRTRREELLACSGVWGSVPQTIKVRWIRALGQERLRAKVRRLGANYLRHPNLDQLLYELVMLGLGYAKNAQPMLDLARRVPINVLRQLPSTIETQSALLGTAGLLPDPGGMGQADRTTVDFVMLLREAFARFARVYPVKMMDESAWRYFRLRPSNFPPLRIAQAATLASREADGLLSRDPRSRLVKAIESGRLSDVQNLFRVDPGSFWTNHVRLDRQARRSSPLVGAERIRAILLNAVAPVLLVQADQASDVDLIEKVFSLVANLTPDNDEVTRIFAHLGSPARDGLEGQGMHELYRSYCTEGRCLACDIGRHLLGTKDPLPAPSGNSSS